MARPRRSARRCGSSACPGYVGGEPEQPVPRDVVAAMTAGEPGAAARRWSVDFWIADADGAAAAAPELGGTVVAEPFDDAMFRRAVLAAPDGATFAVSQLQSELGGESARANRTTASTAPAVTADTTITDGHAPITTPEQVRERERDQPGRGERRRDPRLRRGAATRRCTPARRRPGRRRRAAATRWRRPRRSRR